MDPHVVPSYNHPHYSEMICAAIRELNKEEGSGSSEMEISSYIERRYTGLPLAHRALLTHHLKTLKNGGILSMVNDSYMLVDSYTPESVAVEAAPSFDFVPIDTVVNNESLLDMVFPSRSGFEVPESDNFVPTNTVKDQRLLDPVSASSSVSGSASQPQKRGRGRPRKDGSALSPPASVGARRSGRAKRVVYTIDSEVEEPGMKRGRGGRPRKTATQDSGYGELKRKFNLFQEKVKEIVIVLKAEVTSDNQAVVQAIHDLEGLAAMEETVAPPQVMEEEQPEEATPNAEAGAGAETDGEEHGQEKEVGGEQAQAQAQKEAEAMQETMF